MQPFWYFSIGEHISGPATVEEIRDLLAKGTINSDTLIWRDGWCEWAPLSDSVLSRMTKKPPPLPTLQSGRIVQPSAQEVKGDYSEGTLSTGNAVLSAKRPSAWSYVAAWVVASILTAITSTIIDAALAGLIVKSRDDLDLYCLVVPVIQFFAALLVWIGIYTLFASLNISRVIPFLWGLGALGVAVNRAIAESW